MTELLAADPVRIRRAANMMGDGLCAGINRVSAEIRSVTIECRSDFSVCAATGIVLTKERAIGPNDMSGHVTRGIVDKLAGYMFS